MSGSAATSALRETDLVADRSPVAAPSDAEPRTKHAVRVATPDRQARRPLRVSVAGEERLVVASLRTLLATLPGIDVVEIRADLVVLATDGERAGPCVRGARERDTGAQVICLARSWASDEAAAALEAGAIGCLRTDISPDDLSVALRQAGRGEITLPAELMRGLLTPAAAPAASGLAALSEREVEVLALVAHGQANKEIAQHLLVSVRTIEHHLESIYAKLGVRSRTEAALVAAREGRAAPDE